MNQRVQDCSALFEAILSVDIPILGMDHTTGRMWFRQGVTQEQIDLAEQMKIDSGIEFQTEESQPSA